ncbi:MAG: MT-A70 family methyltransferase [Pseudomonadota bacterium]
MAELQQIPLVLCVARGDARPVDADKVKQLQLSFAEVGLLQPVTVRRQPGQDGYEVIAGLHRVTAARELGWSTISATVVDADELRAELMLIDENLIRNDLSPAERAAALARRKVIYEALHPETVNGAAGRGRPKEQLRKVCEPIAPDADSADAPAPGEPAAAQRFTRATAPMIGSSERKVQMEVRRGEVIGPDALAKVARTSLDKGEELDALAKLPEERRAALIDRAAAGERVSARIEAKRHVRDTREKVTAGILAALPAKRFGVGLEDFEWDYAEWNPDTGSSRSPSMHYETAEAAHTPEQIVARCAERLAMLADDCILFKWATVPHFAIALKVLELQGFNYVTALCWDKLRVGNAHGTGRWFWGEFELVLVGTRGNVVPPAVPRFKNRFEYPVRGHSEKPPNVHEIIEFHWPNTPKIELNARVVRPGWAAWSNEVGFVEASDQSEIGAENRASASCDAACAEDAGPHDLVIPPFLKRRAAGAGDAEAVA